MRVAVAQCGGPTPVVNASLHGALEVLAAGGATALGVAGGTRGLLAGALRPLPGPPPSWLLRAPGAALGAGRLALDPGGVRQMLERLGAARVDGLLLIGGNGTMRLALELAEAGTPLLVAGCPKTIDNDLAGTDHCPGYPSAAAFVARALRDLATDLRAMAGFEDVRLIEVMGRRAGWLCGAAVLARAHPGDLPQRVLLPEEPVDPDALAEELAGLHRRDGSVLIAVAEGVCGPDGRPLGLGALDRAGRLPVLGGAAAVLAGQLRQRLGLAVRAERRGFLPRCLGLAAGRRDRAEARELGRRAAGALLQGRGGVLAALAPRDHPAQAPRYALVPLAEVAGRERPLPPGMRDLGPAFEDWLRPLLDLPARWPLARW